MGHTDLIGLGLDQPRRSPFPRAGPTREDHRGFRVAFSEFQFAWFRRLPNPPDGTPWVGRVLVPVRVLGIRQARSNRP